MLTPEQKQTIEKETEAATNLREEQIKYAGGTTSDKEKYLDGYYNGHECAATAYQEKINQQAEEIERLKSLIEVAYTVGGLNRVKRKNAGNWETFKQQHNL